jgi:hypothetical protein
MVPQGDDPRAARYRRLRFFPFVFLGFGFIGGHGLWPLVLSVIVSVLLTIGISLLIGRGGRRADDRRV